MSQEKQLAAGVDNISIEPQAPAILPPDSPALSGQYDDNYALYKQHAEGDIDLIEAKKVLRKLDRRIVPILFLVYLLQYLDKNGINYASVYGLEEGTHLHGQNYSWLGSIFYFGMQRL